MLYIGGEQRREVIKTKLIKIQKLYKVMREVDEKKGNQKGCPEDDNDYRRVMKTGCET